MARNPYRELPRVDLVAREASSAAPGVAYALIVDAAREAVEEARSAIARGDGPPARARIIADAVARGQALATPTLRSVINATGVLVHTNLGRAPLDPTTVARAAGYCNVEFDLTTGRRGSRRAHVSDLLCALSGAEAALVVNNNAAAVVLTLSGLCHGREVIISRGELVEIGGGFRVPDILATSGARLVEVGTTNRTYARDYAEAIGPDTAAILRVHPSNFRISGFTHRPTVEELVTVARGHGVRLLHDLGSATFGPVPDALAGASEDPRADLAAGVDVVCFSGDKLLGGPQAGIVLGRQEAVDALASHPFARAVRADKLALAALESVLLAYRAGRSDDVPLSRALNQPPSALRSRAEALAARLREAGIEAQCIETSDRIGGGSHPEETLPGYGIAVSYQDQAPEDAASALRNHDPPVIVTRRDDRLVLHLRTVEPTEDHTLFDAISGVRHL